MAPKQKYYDLDNMQLGSIQKVLLDLLMDNKNCEQEKKLVTMTKIRVKY